MAHRTSAIIATLVAAALAACSPPSVVAPLAPQSSGTANSARDDANGALKLQIRVPKRAQTRHVGSRYISAATKGLTMAFTGAAHFSQIIDLTPSDPRCKGTPLTCTFDFGLRAGHYSAKVSTYDQAPVNGAIPPGARLLSTARDVAFTIVVAKSNTVLLTLDGVPASIVVGDFPSASAGSAFLGKSFSVTAKDADGYVIVGTYSTAIVLSDSDTSGATAIATSGSDDPPAGDLLASSDVATISYTGRSITPVTITASAGDVEGSGIFAVLLPVFVGDASGNSVKEIAPGCVNSSCVTTIGGGFGTPEGVALDETGNVFVADSSNNAVKQIPPGCLSAACVNTLSGTFTFPEGVAVDGAGDVFVADTGDNAIKKIPNGCTANTCVVTLGGGFGLPEGVAVDGSGNVFVGDSKNNAVKEIPSGCLTGACVTTLGGGFSGPTGVALDSSGNVYVADNSNWLVKKIPAGCTTASCVDTIGGGFDFPHFVAVDGSGNVFVGDSGNNEVNEIPPGCVSAACVTSLGGGFDVPAGVAVL